MFQSVWRRRWNSAMESAALVTWLVGLAVGFATELPSDGFHCQPGWKLMDQRCYKLPWSDEDGIKRDVATWNQAKRLCAASDAHLISFESVLDDLVIKTRRPQATGLIWIDSTRPETLTNGRCPALDSTSAQIQWTWCQHYLPYLCTYSLEPDSDVATAVDPPVYYQEPTAGTVVLRIGGGIIAGLICVLLLWMAAGIALVVYLKRRIGRDLEHQTIEFRQVGTLPRSAQNDEMRLIKAEQAT